MSGGLFDFLNGSGGIERVLNIGAGALDFAGKLQSADESDQYGRDLAAAARFRADQMRANANTAIAVSQRQAGDALQESRLIASHALAVAAASGGGASDPTVVANIAKIASAGAYKRAVALYEGQDQARQMNMQADATMYEAGMAERRAKQEASGSRMQAATSVLQTYAKDRSLRVKYGGDGPPRSGGSGKPGNAAGGAAFDAGALDFFGGLA
jgi:hypothetical protein